MAITGFETYVPTITDFITHYTATNLARTAPLVLRGGSTVATMDALRDQVATEITEANQKSDAEATASQNYKDARALIYAQMGEFRRLAAYLLVGKEYMGKLLPLPKITRDDGELFRVADSIGYVWGLANADTSVPSGSRPLILTSGVALVGFEAGVGDLRGAQSGISTASNVAATAREVRDRTCADVRRVLKEYRAAILALYPPDSVEVKTLPKLFAQVKAAPDAPKLKVDYVAGESGASLSWSIVPDVSLARFFVMVCPGARYGDKHATRLADLDDEQRAYQTAQGVIAAGATVWFKVFAVDDDGNQTGSTAVRVVRAA